MEELFGLVRRIPRGRCVSYGTLGACLTNRVSGFMVGRWMARAPEGVPWWRVVAKDGHLPISKAAPEYAVEQRRLLTDEGVTFIDDMVDRSTLLSLDEALSL